MGHAAAEAPTHPPAHRYPPPRARPRPDPCHAPSVHRRSCGRRPCPPQVGHAPSRAPEVRDSASSAARDAARPLPCTRGPDAAARGQLGDPPPSPRAGGRGGRLFPFDRGSPGSAPTTPARPGARPRAMLPGRSRWGAIRGGREPQGRRPIFAPSGRPLRPGRSTANGIGASSRTGIGSGAEGAFRLNAGAPADVAACEIVAPRAPPRPRMGRCDDEARPGRRTCSAAGADGPVAGGPAAQKGGRRVSFTPRPAPLPARSGAMTPFPMSAGAAAHPKVTRRPPFSPRRRPGPRRWGPPEVFTHPGRHRHRPVHDGGRCRSDVPREAARRTEGLIPVRAGPVVRDVAPEVGGGGAPREPRRGAAWSASTSLNPRARTPGRRARGLPDDLAG